MSRWLALGSVLFVSGCGGPEGEVDASTDAADPDDSGATADAAAARDAAIDAGLRSDAGRADAGSSDAGSADAGSADAGSSGDAGSFDGGGDAAPCASITCVVPPRQLAPLSTSTVTSQRPTLRWLLPSGADAALVELCPDRACSTSIATNIVAGSSFRGLPLAPGVYFWRVRGVREGVTAVDASPVWQFRVGARDAAVDTSWGADVDVNGDGYDDVLAGAFGVGDVYVFLGGAGGVATTPSQTLSIPIGFDNGWGMPIASAGDLNGDGYGDVAVGEIDRNRPTAGATCGSSSAERAGSSSRR